MATFNRLDYGNHVTYQIEDDLGERANLSPAQVRALTDWLQNQPFTDDATREGTPRSTTSTVELTLWSFPNTHLSTLEKAEAYAHSRKGKTTYVEEIDQSNFHVKFYRILDTRVEVESHEPVQQGRIIGICLPIDESEIEI